jgi:hypothetical protein
MFIALNELLRELRIPAREPTFRKASRGWRHVAVLIERLFFVIEMKVVRLFDMLKSFLGIIGLKMLI